MLRLIANAIESVWSWFSTRARSVQRQAIAERYVHAGTQFGEALSYIAMGECMGFARLQREWTELERQYAKLGYRTIAIDDFIEHGGYGKNISHLIRVERAAGEAAVFHAEVFAQRYSAGFKPKINIKSLLHDGHSQTGHAYIPSTRDAEVHVRPKSDDLDATSN